MIAKKRLAMVQSALSQDASTEFYSSLSKTMADYLADKLNISAAGVSGETVGIYLKKQGLGDDRAEDVSHCLTDLDHRRFSKDGRTKEEMGHSLKVVEQLITKLERQL